MTNRLSKRLILYTLDSRRARFRNLINLIRPRGRLICPDGYSLFFDHNNREWVKKLYEFSVIYGVRFSDKPGYWSYNHDVLTTPQNIKFKIKMFNPLIFAETFLYDTHFSDFDLEGRTVIQAGGFIGDTALYYASRGANVLSFEPDRSAYNQALENLRLNPEIASNVIMKNYALGKDGTIEFPIDPSGGGGSSVYGIENKRTMDVRSVSISTIIKEFKIREPFLLDLDIKGNEFELINDNSISLFYMVRIEYTTFIGSKYIGSRNDLVTKLRNYGFSKIRIFKHNEAAYDLIDHGTIEAIKS